MYIKNFLTDKEKRFGYLCKLGMFNKMNDKSFLELAFKIKMGEKLNLENPQTFNEKLQWLKLYDRNPKYTIMVDKYLAKKYVSDIIGEEYIIPTLGVWNSPDEIDFDKLPDKFVLKCNHNSGIGMCICTDKLKLDIKHVKNELKRGIEQNYYILGREWPYKDVQRKIIAEKYMGADIIDYKLQCFNGNFDNILICTERTSKTGVKYYYFNKEWKYLPYSFEVKPDDNYSLMLKPKNFEKMIELAEILSKGIPEVRVDFYEIDGCIYFGELTFFTQSGFDTTITKFADIEMGNKLNLYKEKKE